MVTTTMGRVILTAKVENLFDLHAREHGLLPADRVRTVEVTDALVDTGATTLLLPSRMIQELGLILFRTRSARGVGGTISMGMYGTVRLTIQGRDCVLDVGEIPDEFPVLIGQVPLELLDFVVDPQGRRLIGNPEHGGEHVIEAFRVGLPGTGATRP
ncbi:MAG: aspartyl protease family protein [Isosphaeraceae bacterium]